MPKALIIYHDETTEIKLLAVKLKQRLQDLGMEVNSSQDKQFKDFGSIHEYDIIALGAPCLVCKKCRGAEECRAPKLLRRHLKKLFKMDLRNKKLITFTISADPNKNEWIRKRFEALTSPTKIKPIVSIGYSGKTPNNLDEIIRTTITAQTIK